MAAPNIDRDYYKCWVGLKQHFDLNAVERLVLEASAPDNATRAELSSNGEKPAYPIQNGVKQEFEQLSV